MRPRSHNLRRAPIRKAYNTIRRATFRPYSRRVIARKRTYKRKLY